MKFTISGANVKVFAKSILSLSKIGDEVYIEPMENSVSDYFNLIKKKGSSKLNGLMLFSFL